MNVVYLLQHDDAYYDMGDVYVRGVFARKEDAEASIVTLTKSGNKSRAYGAHDENCCSVVEWDVEESPETDVQEDPPPAKLDDSIIPQAFIEELAAQTAAPSPFRQMTKRP